MPLKDALLIGTGVAATLAITALLAKKKKKPKTIRVKYFGMPATPGEKLRLALAMTVGKDNFVDDRVVFGSWKDIKPSVKYQQLPVLYLDDVEYHQSGAALRYIGGNLGDGSLYPLGDADALLKIEEMVGVLDDLQRSWMPALYISMRPAHMGHDPNWSDEEKNAKAKEMREKFLADELPKCKIPPQKPTLSPPPLQQSHPPSHDTRLPSFFPSFTRSIDMGYITLALKASGGAFLAGDKFTIADCMAVPQLGYFTRGVADHVPKDCLNKFPEVVAYLARCKAVPAIKEWYASSA